MHFSDSAMLWDRTQPRFALGQKLYPDAELQLQKGWAP